MTLISLFWLIILGLAYNQLLVSGFDGCSETTHYACGDKCGYYCECGNGEDKLTEPGNGKWCCQEEDYSCPAAEDEDSPVYCANATVISLAQSCNGMCNFHMNDSFRNDHSRSYYPCSDSLQCVPEEDLCQGAPLCQDQSDVATCNSEEWLDVSCPFLDEFSRCNKTRHGQCIRNDKLKNNAYDCFDRSDEEPYLKKTESPVDWASLATCTDINQSPGIFCNGSSYPRGDCIPYYVWCKGDQSYKCNTDLSTNNEVICSNFTFWKNQTCELIDSFYDQLIQGTRCNGMNSGECIFPDYEGIEDVSKHCQDKSDERHNKSRNCPDMIYNETLHPHCIEDCYGVCTDGEKSCLVGNYEKCEACLDPTNCRSSCEIPAPSCMACTNPKYFQCSDSFCIDPFLHCDGHPHCANGLDEDLNTCEEEYRKRKVIQQEATYECQSITHPELMTLAIACDGIPECFNGEDEKYCFQNLISPYLFVIVILSLTMMSIFVHWIIQKVSFARSSLSLDSFEEFDVKDLFLYSLITGKQDEESETNLTHVFSESHAQPSYGIEINVSMIGLQSLNIHRNERIALNKKYYSMELEVHNGNVAETMVCLKKNLSWEVCGQINDDLVPGIRSRFTPERVKDWIDAFTATSLGSWMIYIVRRIARISSIYFDFVKDILLFVAMVRILGGPKALLRYPDKFSGQIVFILIASIFIPLITSGIQHAIKSPFLILGFKQKMVENANPMKKWKRKIVQCIVVCFSFLNPVMLQNVLENERQNLMRLIKSGLTSKKQMNLIKEMCGFCKEIKGRLLEFRRGEFAMEIIYQLATQMSMLMLNETLTATTSGLETIFKQDTQADVAGAQAILTLSILASFLSAVSTSIKIKKLEKDDFLSTNGKIITGLRSLLTTVSRVGCLVFFFTPFLGQLNILAHWKAEQIQFNSSGPSQEFYYMDDGQVETIPLKVLNRMDNSTTPHTLPQYSLYTLIDLARAYILLLCLLFVHMIVMHVTKYFTSKSYKQAHFFEKFVHMIECLNIPSIHSDWDCEDGDVAQHRQRWRQAWREMVSMEIITWLSNILLVMPLMVTGQFFIILLIQYYTYDLFTGVKIRERHFLIMATVGAFEEEIHAFNIATVLMWVLPFCVTVVSLLDLALFHLYNMRYHPWKLMLVDDTSGFFGHTKEKKEEINLEASTKL